MISSSRYQFENEKDAPVSHCTRTMCKKRQRWRRAKKCYGFWVQITRERRWKWYYYDFKSHHQFTGFPYDQQIFLKFGEWVNTEDSVLTAEQKK